MSSAVVSVAGLQGIERLRAVSLPEVQALADLQTRKDRKYLVPPAQLAGILDEVAGSMRALEIDGLRSFRYQSVYFDTPKLQSYNGAACRRAHRYKIRTRTYLDSELCQLEVKTRDGRGNTVKHRHDYLPEDRFRLTHDARAFINEVLGSRSIATSLVPTLKTRYSRSTLILDNTPVRVTLDSNLRCSDFLGNSSSLNDSIVFETKSTGAATMVDRLLWRRGLRPLKLSKYGTGLASLQPQLKANKWNRVLREYFGWQPLRPGSDRSL